MKKLVTSFLIILGITFLFGCTTPNDIEVVNVNNYLDEINYSENCVEMFGEDFNFFDDGKTKVCYNEVSATRVIMINDKLYVVQR